MPNRLAKIMTAARARRVARVRSIVRGTADRPRLAVWRSARHIAAQLIDDATARTLLAVHDRELEAAAPSPVERARALGALLARRALERNIRRAVFDRRHYRYHGRVRAFADGAREAGLTI